MLPEIISERPYILIIAVVILLLIAFELFDHVMEKRRKSKFIDREPVDDEVWGNQSKLPRQVRDDIVNDFFLPILEEASGIPREKILPTDGFKTTLNPGFWTLRDFWQDDFEYALWKYISGRYGKTAAKKLACRIGQDMSLGDMLDMILAFEYEMRTYSGVHE